MAIVEQYWSKWCGSGTLGAFTNQIIVWIVAYTCRLSVKSSF